MSSQSGTLVMTRWPAALTAEGSVWTISDLQVLGNARSGAEQDAGQVGPQLILREPEDWIDRHLELLDRAACGPLYILNKPSLMLGANRNVVAACGMVAAPCEIEQPRG
jgi:hypothetical protein